MTSPRFIDLTGQQFGRLIVIQYSHTSNGARYWSCLCDCGNATAVKTASLRYGSSKSCGCGSIEAAKRNTAESGIRRRHKYWPNTPKLKELRRNMIDRCYNPANKRYDCYGERGIKVCDQWLNDRQAFYDWVIANGWARGLEIDRRDVNGNYEPSNCRFVGDLVQANNNRRNHKVTWKGKTQNVSQWERELGSQKLALQKRLDRGWSVERAMSQPFRRPRKRITRAD